MTTPDIQKIAACLIDVDEPGRERLINHYRGLVAGGCQPQEAVVIALEAAAQFVAAQKQEQTHANETL